ncbi:L-fuculose-phosphate aldolase [Paenibacillus phyllosphaerae]|uniref:L-fuculose-phosphate aldolase n=1 Tax=Paenibacillus phyllosphaerae TaxID=274593 RepID=A0A7W5B438_9BACL|nr:class II aldolase/adducin family protein [Paenibacillus phyllosphaerae]MBB3114050.1 L-fuculose-phosphate aldolase [Paenibacillus phyllosphaerae]
MAMQAPVSITDKWKDATYGSHILYLEGHNDINNGQISFRTEEGDIWIRRAFMGWEETTTEDFIRISMDGEKLEGSGVVPAEWPLHTELYRMRQDINCLIHSHPPNAMVFSATELPLRAITHDATPIMNTARFTLTTNTVTNVGVAREVAQAMSNSKTMLLKNHGIVAVGKSIPETICWAIALENACRLQLLAESAGVPYKWTEGDEIKVKSKIIFGRTAIQEYWAYWCRKVNRSRNRGEVG